MIIAIDFDGTICEDKYPAIGEIRALAAHVINKLRSDGHYIIIWTCRKGDSLTDAINWLLANKVQFDAINEQCVDNLKKFPDNSRKVYADVYIDDRQLGELPSWVEIYEMIKMKNDDLNFEKWLITQTVGNIPIEALREIFDAMDNEDK